MRCLSTARSLSCGRWSGFLEVLASAYVFAGARFGSWRPDGVRSGDRARDDGAGRRLQWVLRRYAARTFDRNRRVCDWGVFARTHAWLSRSERGGAAKARWLKRRQFRTMWGRRLRFRLPLLRGMRCELRRVGPCPCSGSLYWVRAGSRCFSRSRIGGAATIGCSFCFVRCMWRTRSGFGGFRSAAAGDRGRGPRADGDIVTAYAQEVMDRYANG